MAQPVQRGGEELEQLLQAHEVFDDADRVKVTFDLPVLTVYVSSVTIHWPTWASTRLRPVHPWPGLNCPPICWASRFQISSLQGPKSFRRIGPRSCLRPSELW